MTSPLIDYFEHAFSRFTLSRRDGSWTLDGSLSKLSPLELNVLAHVIEQRSVVDIKTLVSRQSAHPEKIIQSIRRALGANYIKSQSRCEYIQTVHGQGIKWIYNETRSRGRGLLELHSISANTPQLDSEMLFLKAAIASRINEEMNLTIVEPDQREVNACCVVKGSCLCFDGEYRLLITISSKRGEMQTVRVESRNLFQLIDSATDQVVAIIKELVPETSRA
jgi:DNA-binding winged helix-turn-helix (wHTH) protein